MSIALTVALTALLQTGQASAPALDIGGIEVRLGQDVSDALKALASYQVRYSELCECWMITQKGLVPFEPLGSLSAIEGRVSSITKHYPLDDPFDAARVYSRAARETRRRGGNRCYLSEAASADGERHQFQTKCGMYELVYSLPTTFEHGNIVTGISIRLVK